MQGFKSFSHRLDELEAFRANLGVPVPYGNPFLDDALGGIYPDDFIIMSAKTGGGKTEFIINIAANAALQKKKVHVFALEAHQGEIESRIKFKALSQAFFLQHDWRKSNILPDYQEWIQGKQNSILGKFEPEIKQELQQTLSTLFTFYTDKGFNADSFEAKMFHIGETTDLLIVDHLHYFDIDGRDQNQEYKKAVKQIKEVVSFYRKPVILLAQLRKAEKFSEQLIPEIDDIHGSSDIGKIATKIIVTSPARDQETKTGEKHIFPTYVRIIKNRTSSARTYYTSLCGFDSLKNQYNDVYFLGQLKDNGKTFERLERCDYPQWSKTSSLSVV